MAIDPEDILSVLDCCCDSYKFPMLDNGYVYLAATRLALYRSKVDWAMVIEVFGFSPREGLPNSYIQTFASRLCDRRKAANYVNQSAFELYLANNPNNEFRSIFPIEDGSWHDAENGEFVEERASTVLVRDQAIPLPSMREYADHGIELEQAPRVQVFELCRFLADAARERVLATPKERRVSVPPELEQVFQLEEWHHPNVVDDGDRPSGSETFQQLSQVLATGDVSLYRPSQLPNTHWRNWPDGGRL